MKLLALFVLTMIFIFVLDMIWLGVLAKNIYAQNIGLLLRRTAGGMAPIWWAAALVYVCIALGIIYFVLPDAQGNLAQGFAGGVVLGLVTYGIYEFTNYALLQNWPLKITVIDLAWGMVLCGVSSLFSVFIQNRFFS